MDNYAKNNNEQITMSTEMMILQSLYTCLSVVGMQHFFCYQSICCINQSICILMMLGIFLFLWSIQSHQSHQSHRSNMQSHLHPTGRIFLCSIFPLTFSWYQRFSCTESFKQLSLLFKNECLIDGLSYHTRILHFLATKICLLVGVQKGIINQ